MTFFMLFAFAMFLAIVALLWCFRGFSRELKQPRKPIGLLVRITEVPGTGTSAAVPATREIGRATAASARLEAANVISLALLLGSR